MKDNNYFLVMLGCGCASVALLVVGVVAAQAQWLVMAGGVLPLAYYHLGYLAPRARKGGLSQSAIDSVYYYGFLVTVAALSISALTIANNTSDGHAAANLSTVIFQFGAGLLATAYAVVARMHLSSISTVLDSTSPEALLDRYVQRSLQLVDNAETASARMQNYVNLITARTDEYDSATRQRLERVMLETAGVFAKEFTKTLDAARAGLAEVRETASDLAMQTARSDLARTVEGLHTAMKKLTGAFDELANNSRRSAQGTQDAARSGEVLYTTLSRLNHSVDELAGEQGALPRALQTLNSGSTSVAEGAAAIAESVTTLKAAAVEIQAAAPAFQSVSKVSKKIHQQLAALDEVVVKLESSLQPVATAGEEVGQLKERLHSLTEVLPGLTQQATSLSSEFNRAEAATGRLNGNIGDLAPRHNQLVDLSARIETALQQVAGSVSVVAHNTRELSTSGADMTKLVQTVAELATQTTALKTVIGAAEQGLLDLTTTAQASDRTLGTSSKALASALTTSSQAIADDLRRSSQASAMLTERLVQVVNTIIDRTRAQQGQPT